LAAEDPVSFQPTWPGEPLRAHQTPVDFYNGPDKDLVFDRGGHPRSLKIEETFYI
jgi:hypothetical protein